LRRRVASEERFLGRTLRNSTARGQTLLDVGCGFCRFYPIVSSHGLVYTGVEKNEKTIAQNISRGITCLSPSGAAKLKVKTDVLLLSHIIEHFDHNSLIEFLNAYLPMVTIGGLVVVFTPLSHRGFYDDFDHVKPYNPSALRQALVDNHAQTQSFEIHGQYAELDFWIKRDSLWHSYHERRWMHIIKVPLSLLTTVTFGLVGRVTGYGIVFRKVSD
jgi:SAM-dependent methyltransferase